MATRTQFTTVRTEGGLLPADLLARVAEGDRHLDGLTPEAYHLAAGERLNEAITRAWNRLTAAWATFRAAAAKLPETDPGTSLTRERWLLILFQELGYGRLPTSRGLEVGGKAYPVSHLWQKTPVHLVGVRVDLDRRTAGVAGAARTSPHGLVQELLTRSPEHMWGFVANGLRLRLLRDNASLTRQAFVEFDLEAVMEGEVYADFVLLWLLTHQSRVEGEKPEECWLERWARAAREQGTRALDSLRDGVEAAITALGRGFLAHPANGALRERLRAGTLSTQDYYRQLLRLVYRLLFLFVAEDRDLLLDPKAEPAARERYTRYYSAARLRRLAERTRGTRHPDLYRGLRLVTERLGSDAGYRALGLPALGSFLWSVEAIPDLAAAELANHDFLDAVRPLAFTVHDRVRRPVDYKNLGSEELGSVYESLLELHPKVNADAATFELTTAGGHERKTTGSYYTPASLIRCLLDSALDPVLEEAARRPDPERAILDLKVCDPACGSGHFLIAAAHRIARRLAAIRTRDDEPSPDATRTALRDVIGHCLYGVDVNPMAVELCKVSLWMEALEPGKPLSFLEHRILCGNSLLGATPALLEKGIPDGAFEQVEGDDKKVVTALRRENRKQQQGQRTLLLVAERPATYKVLTESLTSLDAIADDSITGIREKESQYRRLQASSDYEAARLRADAWCAAFVWRKTADAPRPLTQDVFFELSRDPGAIPAETRDEIRRLTRQYPFFHWHLAFPDVFRIPQDGGPDSGQTGWSGGFDVVLGNPPWERIKIQEKEWFATVRPDIADAPNAAARRRMIQALAREDPALYAAFVEARRQAEAESHFVRASGRYPLCGRGDINTYALFAETKLLILGLTGRIGCIVPTGIATDDTTKEFFRSLVEPRSLVSLYDFENAVGMFPGVGHGRYKFSLLTIAGARRPQSSAEFVFFARYAEDVREEWRRFTLAPEDFALLIGRCISNRTSR
ncbi:MAG: N-6 DNA methylase [Candidatus Rokubacteria bacterium]|nr:N-6 DNA methylase [Candidatus Rokubacteria bacterium]